ncbi:MAG: hypothetical protein OEV85_06565 [Candidatus Thorarchaeota archaeon]|nr:hypothetical protein [Candidatus Thorarchaeota archaeon]
MRRRNLVPLVLITFFILSLANPSGYDNASSISPTNLDFSDTGFLADGAPPYTGIGSALTVSLSGTFVNSSPWTQTSATLSAQLTFGTSFSATNASTVTWTAYVLVSPPAQVNTLSFSVTFPVTDWRIVSVTDPLGIIQANPADWYTDYNQVIVRSSAVDTHGLWKLTFVSANYLSDLELGPSGGPYSATATFDTGYTMRFITSSPWITGASAEFDLLDPTGSVWYSSSTTTSGPTTHMLPSFRYSKVITIHNEYVTGDFTGFPVLIDILDADLHTKVQSDGDDITFYSGGAIVPHEIELFKQNYDSTYAHLVAWVKVNLANFADVDITMYYGNPVVGSQQNPAAVWTSNYAAVWHLSEQATNGQTSTDFSDSTGHGYYGDQVGNSNTTGIFGTGQYFDGSDTINVASARGLNPFGSATISGWFKLNSPISDVVGTTQVILTKAIDVDTDIHVLITGSDWTQTYVPKGKLVFKMEKSGLGAKYVWSSTTSWSAGNWYFFACTLNVNDQSLNRVFVNGVEEYGGAYGSSTGNLVFNAPWKIGGGFVEYVPGQQGWFQGVIDEVRVATTLKSPQWIQTEWLMYQSSSSFRTIASPSTQTSPEMYIEKLVDADFPAGLWTVSTHYNDSGSTVNYRVGEYQRNFIIRRASTLEIDSPSDAAAGLEELTVGDLLYLVVDLSDTGTGAPITEATVSMNWTVAGSATTVYFEDLGDGRYSIARNTSELSDRTRWLINIDSSHQYYFDDSTSFNLDLFHPTQLTYEWVSTTPVGFDFTATLVYRDTWDGSLISGATITFDDGSPVTTIPWGVGRYNISIPTGALSKGLYYYTFNATNNAALYEVASVEVSFQLRAHYTAVSVSGNLITPYGDDTIVNIVLIDLDTRETLDASVVDSLSFASIEGTQSELSVFNLVGMTLDTNTWVVGLHSVNLTVLMSDTDYDAPDIYTFDVAIRNHLTSANVVGNLTTAFGANTTLTVSLTDLDGGVIVIGAVSSFTFSSSQPPIQIYNNPSSFTIILDTDNWPVSTIIVTLAVDLSGNYDDPANYIFSITIRKLQTTLYNAPNDLVFTQGSDFTVDVHFNVSESGTYYGWPINGESGQFVVTSSLTLSGTTVSPLGNGMYSIMIPWSNFDGQGTDFTINVIVTPGSSLYASAGCVISFRYRAIISDLTANLYTISTPYNKDVTLHLYYTDRDSGTGITTATFSVNPDILISAIHVSNGDYLVTLDSSSLAIGSHEINLTASASVYEDRWVIITIIVTQIHTDAEPSTIRLEIPSGNTKIFTIAWTDLDNSLPIQTTIGNIANNWNGTAPSIVWTGTQYQITFVTTTSDALGIYLLWFNFTKGAEYQPGYCEIQIEIRSHDTILTAETPPPTAYNSIINITVFYYDFDNKVGIKNALVDFYVENATGVVSSSYAYNLILGDGFYTISIPASQFGLGPQTFTIYVEWIGVIQQYENNVAVVSTNIIGVDCLLILVTASDPSSYLEIMIYEFLYSEKDSGIGITNSFDQGYGTGHVDISVVFDVPFDMGKVTITEVDPVTNPGLYRIEIDTTGFGDIGQFTMTITIDWTGTEPFYSTLEDSVSVWVLSRATLLLINPPSPESYGEIASFSFRWEDTGLGTDILDSTELNISMDITFIYVHNAGLFTITFDTSQFGSIGVHVITLNVTWAGEPFYSNKTNRLVSINVLARQTVLDYPTPDPTFYGDNVTITVTWTDVTNGGSNGILGATITVTDNYGVINPSLYDVREYAGGVYEIEFSTSRYASTGLWNISVQVHVPVSYIADRQIARNLDLRERRTILSYEAVGKIAYGNPIEFILYYEDLYTTAIIGNGTGAATLEILTAGSWSFTSTWNATNSRYDVVIYSYPAYSIGVPFNVIFRMSYSNIIPFYADDDLTASFELRERLSLLSLEVAPSPTPYLDYSVFQVQFLDVDSDSGIAADDIQVYFGATPLAYGSEGYQYSSLSSGLYEISVNSTIFGSLGQFSVTVYAYWSSGAPYHGDANTPVKIRVTTRDTIVDITTPPPQTPFLDNVIFAFEYVDLFSGNAITSILATDISLYKNGTLVSSGDYTLTPSGSEFILTVDSEILGSTLGRYNLTIVVNWNELTSPFYVDAPATIWASVTTRTLSFALDPFDKTRYGDLFNITFILSDMANAALVDGAVISFSCQTVILNSSDYSITKVGDGSGEYIVRVNTLALLQPGTYKFNLNIGWNSATAPYYRPMNPIVLTGVVSNIATELIPLSDQVTVGWKENASITLDYRNLLWMNLTSGATVTWTWLYGVGELGEIAFKGNYTGVISTSLANAGTYIITIVASKDYFETARAYITLVIQPIPSKISPINPPSGSIAIPRGSSLSITIYLEDVNNILPIPDTYKVSLIAIFVEQVFNFTYNGTPGYYTTILPANGPTIQSQGTYSLLIQARFDNFAPSSFIFNIELQASRTEILLSGDTSEDMSVTYSKTVTFTANLTKPDFGGELFANATLRWIIDARGWSGYFEPNGDGTFYAELDTTSLGFGIWPVRIQANVWANSSEFTDSSAQLTLTITRIQTDVIRPTGLDVAWGWKGNLTFIYNGTFGPIEGALVEDPRGGILTGMLYELPGGVYMVEVDTTLASPGIFTVTMLFQKENYQDAPVGIQFIVRPADTEIFVSSVSYTPTYEQVLEDLRNLQIPLGDIVTIEFYYNDTDTGNEFVGGLAGALSTENSYLRGISIESSLNITVLDLGGGLYRVIFDTTDVDIDAIVSSEPYRLYIEMSLANRTNAEILFRITVIDIPTRLSILNEQPIWNLVNGESLTIVLQYWDTWHNIGIEGVHFSVNASRGAPFTVSMQEDIIPGQYLVVVSATGIKLTPGSGSITVMIGDGVYTIGEHALIVEVLQNDFDIIMTNAITFGLPIGLVVLLLGFAYVRVWSVPKRLRQINAQINSVRKGKIPKPVVEAKNRQELIADLFNDTYAKVGIVRTPDDMPEESVPVQVPELGELLIQLAILTNLNAQELDDFKADISKMKMSEQAAFVKEVIMQEAIRTARRDHKSVELVIAEVQADAVRRVAGGVEDLIKEEKEVEPEAERVILPSAKEPVTPRPGTRFEEPEAPKDEEAEIPSDRLSPFEIEELKKNLETRGIPPHEIDTILKQARQLPRDLVEELIRSLEKKRES